MKAALALVYANSSGIVSFIPGFVKTLKLNHIDFSVSHMIMS